MKTTNAIARQMRDIPVLPINAHTTIAITGTRRLAKIFVQLKLWVAESIMMLDFNDNELIMKKERRVRSALYRKSGSGNTFGQIKEASDSTSLCIGCADALANSA